MTSIYIENQRLDSSNLPALITFQLDDVKDFASRNTTFSKTITLPGTSNNNKLFGHYFETKVVNPYNSAATNVSTNFNAAKSAKCVILQDNVQAFKGVIRLMEVVIDGEQIEYECSVFGELGGFIAKMAALKLSDLDFSAYDHQFTIANITASWSNYNAGSGYYYPLIDYGTYGLNSKHDWKVGTFRAAIFVKEILEKIVEAAGYTMTFALKETERFKRLIIPYGRKAFTALNTTVLNRTAADQDLSDLGTTYMTFGSGSLGAFTTSTSQLFTYAGATPTVATVTVNIYVNSYSSFPTLGNDPRFELRKNSVVIGTVEPSAVGSWQIVANSVNLTSGDILEVEVLNTLPSIDINVYGTLVVVTDVAISTEIVINDTVKVNDCLPQNILQKDFFSSLLRLFNLYVYEDATKFKHLNIAPYVDFFLPVSGSVNWDNKLDRGSVRKLKPMSEINSRYYHFKFKSDADFYNDLYKKRYNEGYGDRIYDSEFEFATETNAAEVIFSGTPLVGYSGEEKVYSTIFKQNNNVEEMIDSNIRILQALNVTGVTSWNIRNSTDTTTLGSYTTYPYAGHLNDPDAPSNDIHFGVPKELFFTIATGDLSANQFNVYWSPYMAEITDKDSKMMTCTMYLKMSDIVNLNFGKYVWIDGVLWRLNKIEDYNLMEPDTCTVQLLRVIYTEY